MLTLGYAIAIVAFIRVGEKLLQSIRRAQADDLGQPDRRTVDCDADADPVVAQAIHRSRSRRCTRSLVWGSPSTPPRRPMPRCPICPDDQAGSGSGLYKMASSLGASFGVAISAAIFTALSGDSGSTRWLEGMLTFAGRQDNVAVRQAAFDCAGVQSPDGRGRRPVHRHDDTQRPHAASPAVGARPANQAGTVALNRPRRASGANSASGVDPRRRCSVLHVAVALVDLYL